MSPETVIRTFAERHHGLALVADYYAAGGTRSSRRNLLVQGRWAMEGRRVLRLIGVPQTERQRALVTVLDAIDDAPAGLSHQSDAAFFGVPGFDLLPAHVTREQHASNRQRPVLGIGHWCACLDRHLTEVDGIPVVTPSYLVLQLFGTVHPKRAARAASTMLTRRLVTERSLTRVLDQVAASGRDGITHLRAFLDGHPANGRTFESGLEQRFDQILVEGGEEPMRRQVDVGDSDEWLGRVDFIDRRLPFIVQIDSEVHHGALIDAEADRRQTARLQDAGFTVERITDTDCWHRPAHVLDIVRRRRRELRHLAA